MDLLNFIRGPLLAVAIGVFVAGTLWRLYGLMRLPSRPDRSPPREGAAHPARAALGAIVRRMRPRPEFAGSTLMATANGYAFHLGLALVFFGYAPHIAFVQRLTGLSWPALPDAVMALASGVTIVALLMALWMRLAEPVRRRISNADDWISWTLTFAPMLTGMALISGPSSAALAPGKVLYPGPLALHLLSLELLLIWFPFGKLMHAVLFAFSRGATGLRFGHRGVTP